MKTVLEHWDKDSKEKAIKEREAREREAKDKEEAADFKERLTKSERDLSRTEQFQERLTRSFKDLNHASGNWVAARRKAKTESTKEPYLEGKGKRGGSDLAVGTDYGKPEDSNQNGKDENLLSRSANLSCEDLPTEDTNSSTCNTPPTERGILVCFIILYYILLFYILLIIMLIVGTKRIQERLATSTPKKRTTTSWPATHSN